MARKRNAMAANPLRPAPINNESEPQPGFIVGGGNGKGGSVVAANHHNGIVIGGSITSARESVDHRSINRLASNRDDGRVV